VRTDTFSRRGEVEVAYEVILGELAFILCVVVFGLVTRQFTWKEAVDLFWLVLTFKWGEAWRLAAFIGNRGSGKWSKRKKSQKQ
jgi:hypothetical protein